MTSSTTERLTFSTLREMCTSTTVAIRGFAELEPAGGPGDKVFPPSHSVDKNVRDSGGKYAFETRRISGREVRCVLLDSVQSQANRMEEALQALWADKRIALPVIAVDLRAVAPDVGTVTSLTAPHRVADAILRDSFQDDKLFRLSDLGRSFADATAKNATPLFRVCPTGLVFGLWDSTGPKGGLGSKFARALVSEIVGIDAVPGAKTASRIDPTGIVTKAAEILVAASSDERWTHDPSLAKQDKGKPIKLGDGRVSEVNHSNVPPTIEHLAGGVTIEHASHVAVLSLAALRKLSFGSSEDDLAARTVLAALGLVAILAAESRGHDLRSRCLLVPREGRSLRLESIGRDGTRTPVGLDLESALALYTETVQRLPPALSETFKAGEPIATLTPSPKLAHLITRSRELAAAGADLGEE